MSILFITVVVSEGYPLPGRELNEVSITIDGNDVFCISDHHGEINLSVEDLMASLRHFGYSFIKEESNGEPST
jgi:hypothetical protein